MIVSRTTRLKALGFGGWKPVFAILLKKLIEFQKTAKNQFEHVQAHLASDQHITHNENTIPKWNGEDYFVMVRSDFHYSRYRESLRALAIDWIAAGCPNQIKSG